MIIECPECGTKNQTLQPPQSGKRYRCGKCGAVIDLLQAIDTPSETTSTAEKTFGQHRSTTIIEESRGWKWSDALKPGGRFSRLQFAFFYFIPIIVTYFLYFLGGVFFEFLIIAGLWSLFQLYVVIIAGIRRLHDLNQSGLVLLFIFIPFANIILFLYLLFAPGKKEGNRWA